GMRLAAGALAEVVVLPGIEKARAGAATAPAGLPRAARRDSQLLPVGVVRLRQVHAEGGAEGHVRARLPIKPLAFAADFPAALALPGLPRQEVLEVGVVVVGAADAAALHAE